MKFRIRSNRYRGKGRPRKSDYDFITLKQFGRAAKAKLDRMAARVFSNAFTYQTKIMKGSSNERRIRAKHSGRK